MGCVKTSGKSATLNLTWAADAKGYNPTELNLLVGYIDQTLAWLDTIGWVEGDVCAYRVGIPVIVSTKNTELEELYTIEANETDYIINGLSLDMVKITAKGYAINGVDRVPRYEGYNDTYTYKSQYHHHILENYFIDGVNNATRWTTPERTIKTIIIPEVVHTEKYTYIDEPEYNCNKSALVGLRAEYNGVRQIAYTPKKLPDYVVKCFTMIAQNFRMLGEFSETETEKKGDIVYIGIAKLIHKLNLVKTRREEKFFGEYYEDIKYILDYTGLDKAFKDVQYGGQIEKLDLVMRIPASWNNEKTLKSLIEDKEVALHYGIRLDQVNESHRDGFFNYIFKSEMIAEDAFSGTAISEHVKVEELLDVDRVNEALNRVRAIADNEYDKITNDDLWTINQWFTTTNGYGKSDIAAIKLLSIEYSQTKGCKWQYDVTSSNEDNGSITTTYTEYRHWYVRASWLDRLDYSRAAIVFWMGMDLSTTSNKRCEHDQIIIIVIVLIITIASAGAAAGSGLAYANYYAAAIATSGIISVGLTMGAFGTGRRARNMAILAAVLSIGGNAGTTFGIGGANATAAAVNVTTTATIGFALETAGTLIGVAQTELQYKHNKDMESMQEELDTLQQATMYESRLRMVYEHSYKAPQTIMERDPYQPIKDMYKPYTTYNTMGFRET